MGILKKIGRIFRRKQAHEYVCGICGTTEEDKYGFCKKGHDYWIHSDDLGNPDLKQWVDSANFSKREIRRILNG